MADNQNEKKKKKGQGQGGGLRIVDFVFDGSKASGAIEFRALQGNQGRVGVRTEFYLGTATRRFAVRLTEAGGNPWAITTVNGGIGQREINLSDPAFKDYSRLTIAPPSIAAAPATGGGALYAPTFEPVTLDLPSDEQAPGKVPKRKRLECKVPEDPLKSPDNHYTLPTVRTISKDGKGESADLLFRASEEVTVINVETGTAIAHDQKVIAVKTAGNGLLLAEIQFAGFERTITIVHVESGEEVSMRLEFEI